MKKTKIINYVIFLGVAIFLNMNFVSALSGECVVCGSSSIAIPIAFPKFVSGVIKVVQLLVPLIIIFVGMFEFFKAVINGDDKVYKETTSAFIKRIIAGVVIFLIIALVKLAFNIIGDEGKNSLSCVSCFLDLDSCQEQACPARVESLKTNCSAFVTKEECKSNSDECVWKFDEYNVSSGVTDAISDSLKEATRNEENGKCISIEKAEEDDDGRTTVHETESGRLSGGGSREF